MSLISVIHGPNLNLLGTREPELYGTLTLKELDQELVSLADSLGHEIEIFQSNHEGALVDKIQSLRGRARALILNAAGYTHTSVAIRDAILAVRDQTLVLEVHLTVPASREAFRERNLLSDVVQGRIEGFGGMSYLLALRAASRLIALGGDL